MAETTVSSKYQVVIPKAIRERAKIKPGQKYVVLLKGRVISLVPEVEPGSLFGAFPGLGEFNEREKEDRVLESSVHQGGSSTSGRPSSGNGMPRMWMRGRCSCQR